MVNVILGRSLFCQTLAGPSPTHIPDQSLAPGRKDMGLKSDKSGPQQYYVKSGFQINLNEPNSHIQRFWESDGKGTFTVFPASRAPRNRESHIGVIGSVKSDPGGV